MKIASKISSSFLVTGLVITSIAMASFYFIERDALQESISNNLSTTVASRTNHVGTYLEMLGISVGQLSKSTILESLLKINGKEDNGWHEAFEQATRRLKKTKEANPAITEFMLMDKAGKVVASSNESSVGMDKSSDAFFLGGQRGVYIKDVYYSEVYKEFSMAVSAPILDSHTQEFLGVLAARTKLNDLNNIVTAKTGLGDTGEIYVVNKYGYMITPSRFKEDAVLKQKTETKNVRMAQRIYPDYRGVQVLGAQEYIPRMQWVVLAEINREEAFRPLAKLRTNFFVILCIASIAAWLLGIFISRAITGPLHRLHKGAEIIGSGNLDYKVGINTEDEVGQLSRAFDQMTQDMKKTTTSIDNLNKEITERKLAEEALRKNEMMLRSVVSAAPVGIAVGLNRVIGWVNDYFSELTGYTREELINKSIRMLYETEQEYDHVGKEFYKGLIEKGIANTEVRWKRKDGRRLDIYLSGSVIDPQDISKGIVFTSMDITERKKAGEERERILHWQQDINALQQSLLVPVALDDKLKNITDGVVRMFRADFCRIWLVRPGDLCEQGCIHAEVKEGPHVCRFRDKCLHLIASSGRYTHTDGKGHARVPFDCYKIGRIASGEEHRFLTNDVMNDPRVHDHEWARELGLVSFAGYQLKIPSGETAGVLALFAKQPIVPAEDAMLDNLSITTAFVVQQAGAEDDLKRQAQQLDGILEESLKSRDILASMLADNNQVRERLEKSLEELKGAQALLVHAEKMEAIGRMASGVAHEVKNPLGIILQGVNYFEGEFSPDQKDSREILQMMKDSIKRADSIVRALLDFSRAEEIKTETQDINTIIESSIGLVQHKLRFNSVEPERELEKDLPKVLIDKGKIEQVFVNLFNNAADAMPKGGKLYIRSHLSGLEASGDKTGIREKVLMVEVEDTGAGIDEDIINKIFDPFFTTKNRTEGTGLGLSVAKSIIEMHKGLISVESKKGKGTKFTVFFKIPKEGRG